MHVFYAPTADQDRLTLDESESGHAVRVLRLKSGDGVTVMDGKGYVLTAIVTEPHPKHCILSVTERNYYHKKEPMLHIAMAPLKLNERTEWFLEKATEIGIDEITPLICSHSERRVVNIDRFRKVLIAAMKQSLNPWLPVLNEPVSFDLFIKSAEPGYIAHCRDGEKTALRNISPKGNQLTVLIGPEGDFTNDEVKLSLTTGWSAISLGESRLRTETAGIMVCAAAGMLLRDRNS
jgi:16S rRNA (uracil1498-N3)-methyltransferase